MTDLEIPELDVPFVFRARPMPMPPDFRPDWRIAVILLLLRHCCRKNHSTFARLHVLNWAIRDSSGQKTMRELLLGAADPSATVVRIEPSLNRAVDFARAEGLTRFAGGAIELTPKGFNAAEDLWAMSDALVQEKAFIREIKGRVTEKLVTALLKQEK